MTEVVFSPESAAFDAAKAAQADAANPLQSAWVEANAGSGKTKVLIDRVARLLLRRPDGRPGALPDSILCITYTKAAANEMLSRLYARLGDWAVATDSDLRKSLSQLEDRDPTSYTDEDLLEARRLFARALETPGGLRIETIHAFCARILRRFPLEAGISPGFTAIEEDEADRIWQAVLAAGMEHANAVAPDQLSTLAEATGGLGIGAALEALRYHRDALQAFSRTFSSDLELINIVHRASGSDGRAPEQILSKAMLEELPTDTLHSALADLRALEKPGKSDEKLRDTLLEVLNTDDPDARYEIYMSAIAGAKRDFPSGSNPFTSKAGPVVVDLFSRSQKSGDPEGREITRMKAVQQTLKASALAARTLALLQIGVPVLEAYAREKKLRGALDFDDLIVRTHALLTQSNASEWVLYKLDGGLTHLLLDEAQDTSPPQWALINAIVSEFQSGMGSERQADPRTQFVVGDPKQSIYSFQGADQQKFQAERQNFVRREEIVAEAENRRVNLPNMAMSFRSTPEVLRFVDEVRAVVPLNDAATDPLPARAADVTPHAPRRLNQPGRVEVWPLVLPMSGDAEESAWTAPTDHVPADAPRRRLARMIAQEVRQMLDRGDAVWREKSDRSWQRDPLRPDDILILVRSRNDLFDALIESLKQESVPVAGADRLRLLDNLGVQDCLNLIRFALQPSDDLTLAEILRGPFCGLVDDDKHLFQLAYNRPPGTRLFDQLLSTQNPDFAQSKTFCQSLIQDRDLPAFEFLARVLKTRDDEGLSGWDKLIQRLGEPVRDPVEALVSRALSYDMSHARSLQAFLAEIEQQDAVLKRELGEPAGAVRVMTVHGAKGLQSPLVIVPDTTGGTKSVSDAIFMSENGVPLYSPSSRTDAAVTSALREAANASAERESRRLLYVALTRASDRLIIAGAGLGNSKSGYSKSSWYRWCQKAMLELIEAPDEEEHLEPKLVFGADPVRLPRKDANCKTQAEAPAWLKRQAPAPKPPQRLAAPSRLTEDRSAVSLPFGEGRKIALRRGRHIHALLQTLPELPEQDRASAARRYLERDPELSGAEVDEMCSVTLQTLEHPEFQRVFGPGGRSEAAIVGTLQIGTPPEERLVNGRVDRLIVDDGSVFIVDYKTDRPAPDSAAEIDFSYRVQLAAYRAVLSEIYPNKTIRCGLLYTDGPRLIELSADDLSESLKRVDSGV